jgi:Tfp pilus assembly protein PilX
VNDHVRNLILPRMRLLNSTTREVKTLVADAGFAFPSILLLITILSLVAISIMSLQYFQRLITAREVARAKAMYAAEGSIMKALKRIKNNNIAVLDPMNNEDSYNAQTTLEPWGMLSYIRSEGRSGRITNTQCALVAEQTPEVLKNALYLANPDHQLVFTGTSLIKGNVVVGQNGVTIGNLQSYSTPIKVPIEGTITKSNNPQLPSVQFANLENQLALFQKLLSNTNNPPSSNNILSFSSASTTLSNGMIGDSITYVYVKGNLEISDSLKRRENPLYIIAGGNITISSSANLNGLVAVLSNRTISIEAGSEIKQSIICSKDSINVANEAQISAQLIAPKIEFQERSVAKYPSFVLSTCISRLDSTQQCLKILNNAMIEGFVGLISVNGFNIDKPIITVQPEAKVLGLLYCDSRILLDGTVIGTVITKDFYFYQEPTTYLGWLRSGRIDRSSLPKGFLVPPGFLPDSKLDILAWL